ncbi:tetraspanin-32 isoform X3 [Cygnus olor]|uniref:tetraspanin-32 isoform X3 n=1 Tax=Cygnus olor TaxID=8869 RepID=UPI001ADEAE77|nr:tetraspanin-32 isoform X3 [Cygnus olor]
MLRLRDCFTRRGFFCFALAFCGLIPAACWRYARSTEWSPVTADIRGGAAPSDLMQVLEARAPRLLCFLVPAGFLQLGLTGLRKPEAEVEDRMMDVYDLVYEEVRRNISSFRRHELTAIHEAFLCCGKRSPFGDTAAVEHKTCPPGQAQAARQDCLREIQGFLKKHMDLVSTLLGITICFTVYGMVLTSFLWFSIHFSNNLDRKGKYILRAR